LLKGSLTTGTAPVLKLHFKGISNELRRGPTYLSSKKKKEKKALPAPNTSILIPRSVINRRLFFLYRFIRQLSVKKQNKKNGKRNNKNENNKKPYASRLLKDK